MIGERLKKKDIDSLDFTKKNTLFWIWCGKQLFIDIKLELLEWNIFLMLFFNMTYFYDSIFWDIFVQFQVDTYYHISIVETLAYSKFVPLLGNSFTFLLLPLKKIMFIQKKVRGCQLVIYQFLFVKVKELIFVQIWNPRHRSYLELTSLVRNVTR